MFESKYSKVLTIVLAVVILAILILLGFLIYDYVEKNKIAKQASNMAEQFQEDFSTGEDTREIENLGESEGSLEATPTVSSGNNTNKKQINGFTIVGTMKIPDINFNYPILEELTTKSLETAVVIIYPSPDNINLPGNSVIIGHNYRNGLFFSNLKKLGNGAKIIVTDYRGTTLNYEVYHKFEAADTDTSFYTRDTNGKAELTLSTCTDASNSQRTILFAREI